ncbi:MAG: glycosyltransferase family 4 protein [Phycisphaerales bacterium]
MRITFLNQTFYPDVAATAQHAHDLARHLAAAGHEVSAVTSRSLYGTKGATLPRCETVDGIRVHRVGQSLFGKAGIVARMIDFALFYVAALLKLLTLPKQDVIVCLTTPPFITLAGLIVRMLRGGKTVYWVMDMYPDLPIACGVLRPTHPVAWIGERLDRYCVRHVDAAVVLGRCMRDRVLAKGAKPERVHLIGVWSDQDELAARTDAPNAFRSEWGIDDRLLVMYSGNFGLGHDIETFLAAARELRNNDRVRFAFVGGGKRKAEVDASVREHGLANCILAPYQPRARLAELLDAGDVHLISLKVGVEGIMVPSKYYGVLGVGKPAIFIGDAKSEIARCIREDDCGTVIAPGDSASLVAAIEAYARDAERRRAEGARGLESLVAKHSRIVRCEEWRRLLESMGSQGTP